MFCLCPIITLCGDTRQRRRTCLFRHAAASQKSFFGLRLLRCSLVLIKIMSVYGYTVLPADDTISLRHKSFRRPQLLLLNWVERCRKYKNVHVLVKDAGIYAASRCDSKQRKKLKIENKWPIGLQPVQMSEWKVQESAV